MIDRGPVAAALRFVLRVLLHGPPPMPPFGTPTLPLLLVVVTALATAVLAVQLTRCGMAGAPVVRGPGPAGRSRRAAGGDPARQSRPDAAGRPRPRAPARPPTAPDRSRAPDRAVTARTRP